MSHASSKLASTDHDIEQLLGTRWSPRAFDGRPVPRAEVLRALEAARWSASCANEQPWRFVVALREDSEAFERLLACLTETNQRWASRAGALILVATKLTFDRNGAANRYAQHDAGMALAHLLLQATALGLAGHPMAGFDANAARAACDIPAGFDPVSVTALGYAGDLDLLDEPQRARELAARERLPLTAIAFSGRWAREL